MRLLVLDENYPHMENLMADVFVHVRVKEYAKHHHVQAFSYFNPPKILEYEGIKLQIFDTINSLVSAAKQFRPDKILIHFYQSWMLEKLIRVINVPVIIWVHGFEALGWYRRLFNFRFYSPVYFLNYVISNSKQQYHFRQLIKYSNEKKSSGFVFVSKWMKRITETDTLSKVLHSKIIANPIDVKLFSLKRKDAELRKNVLLLRSFVSRKYANDVSVKAILLLAERPCFKEFSFTLIGLGLLFDKTMKPLYKFENVKIKKAAIRHILIPELHAEHGIFLCPTRQDAQGVSMCEAMSSGLVPVTSDNTAIPEFVKNNQTGILTNSAKEIADALEELLMSPEKFLQLSQNAGNSIRKQCSIEPIISEEISLIENGF